MILFIPRPKITSKRNKQNPTVFQNEEPLGLSDCPTQAAQRISPLVLPENRESTQEGAGRGVAGKTIPGSGPARRVREQEALIYAAIKNPCSLQCSGRRDACVAGIQSWGECRLGCDPLGLIYELLH